MSRRVALRLLFLAVVAIGLLIAWQTGALETYSDRDELEELFTESGVWGPVVFVAAFATSHPVGLPSVALTFVAGLIWASPLAIALSWIGGMCGTLVAFSFARWFARDWVEARLPERFLKWDDRLARQAVGTIALVRLFTYLPPPADWFFGVSRVSLRQFVVGTAVGIIPATVFIVLAGEEALNRIGSSGPAGWAFAAVLIALMVTIRILVRRRNGENPGV